jgi:hypothetical protein
MGELKKQYLEMIFGKSRSSAADVRQTELATTVHQQAENFKEWEQRHETIICPQ